MKKFRLLDIVSLALLLPAFGLAAYRFVPPFRASILYAVGKAPNCSFQEAMKSDAMIQTHLKRVGELQAASRITERDGNLNLWTTPHGHYWMPSGDKEVLMSLLTEQEHLIYGAPGDRGVHPGDVVLDCGAHVGTYTREALKTGAKLVVAIEPAPDNLLCLRRNLAKEIAEGRVIVVPKGVWDQKGQLTFHVDKANSAGDSIVFGDQPTQPGDIRIEVTTIDQIARELKLSTVNLIKMDIEGSERKALMGGLEVLKKFRPRMALCTYHLEDDAVVVPATVKSIVPDYAFICGPCGEQDGRIIPQTLLFR
jgi:FkbM family methyltransferase